MLTEAQTRWITAHQAQASRLAALVSLAALVDPGLLRMARIALELAVSVELDLRCSPLVSSASQAGLVLAEEVLPMLRSRLDRQALDLAWQLTRARHRALSPALVLEETLTWEALSGHAGVEAETMLNRALVAIVRDKKTQLAGWAARALPRLPEELRRLPSARYLASAAQANGFRTSPMLPVDGPPPAWMLPQPPGTSQLQGSVVFYGTTLELNYPPRSGEQTIPLPENRRIWISWWQAHRRVWAERTVPSSRTLSLAVEGSEIVIEAPGFGRVRIEDQSAPLAEIAIYGGISPTSLSLQLQQSLRDHLAAKGVRVAIPQDLGSLRGNSSHYLLVVTGPPLEGGNIFQAMQMSAQDDWVRTALAQCRPILVLEAPGAQPIPSLFANEWLTTFDCRDPSRWDQLIQSVVKLVLEGPPQLTEITGAPAVPTAFVRRRALYAELRTALLSQTAPLVNLYGAEGSGRTMAAADLLQDCAVRRRFKAGIRWLQAGEEDSLKAFLTSRSGPYLVVFQGPLHVSSEQSQTELILQLNSEQLPGDFGTLALVGSGLVLLTTDPLAGNTPLQLVDGGVWQPHESLALFRKSVSSAEVESQIEAAQSLVGAPSDLAKMLSLLPARSVANLGWLAGMIVRSQENPSLDTTTFWDGVSPASLAQRQLLFQLDLVRPFAAFPRGQQFSEINDPVWERYFEPTYHARIVEAYDLIYLVFLKNEGPWPGMTQWASNALAELALPTHERIIESYREQCGGDWAICADDGYFLRFFAWHLLQADQIPELTDNLDWIMRASREAPGWHKVLPSTVGLDYLDSPNQALTLEYFAHEWLSEPSSKLRISAVQRMAEARLALLHNEPVRWILVVDWGSDQLDPLLATLSECVGRELARWGYGLVTDAAPGVVAYTAEAYRGQLSKDGFPPQAGLVQALEPVGPAEELPWLGRNKAWIDRADAVVVIGDNTETIEQSGLLRLLSVSLGTAPQKRPVIPICESGSVVEGVEAKRIAVMEVEAWATLRKKLVSRTTCYEIARALIKLLPEQPTKAAQAP